MQMTYTRKWDNKTIVRYQAESNAQKLCRGAHEQLEASFCNPPKSLCFQTKRIFKALTVLLSFC